MRAIAVIQPLETMEALAAGLKDACGDIRRVASAGWMNATAISEAAIPTLIEGLSDPEVQVRGELRRMRWPGLTRSRPRPSLLWSNARPTPTTACA